MEKNNNCICDVCKIEYYKPTTELKRWKKNFCSKKCMGIDYSKSEEVECAQCQKIFLKKAKEIKRSKNHFCSRSCSASYNNTHKQYGVRRSKLESYLENVIKEKYPDLEMICNSKSLIESELDFYFPQLNFAIELNGIVHYEPIYGEDKFEKIQNNDKRKVIACYEKDIELAIIDTSSCSYLSENNKIKFKNIVLGLLQKVINRI